MINMINPSLVVAIDTTTPKPRIVWSQKRRLWVCWNDVHDYRGGGLTPGLAYTDWFDYLPYRTQRLLRRQGRAP